MLRRDPERSECFITEEKWDIFSKTQPLMKNLSEWQKWFKARGKPTRIERSKTNKGWVLLVFQEWHVHENS